MSLLKRIFYNTVSQTLGKILAAAIGLVTVSVLSQHLQEKGFGQYSTVTAFLGFLVVLADLGLYLYVVREISKEGTNRFAIISNALGLRLVISLGILILGSLAAFLFPYEPIVKQTMFVGILAFLFVSLNQVLIGIFQKHLVQHLVVISETIGRAINLLLILWFMQGSLPLPFFFISLIAGNGVNFFLTLYFARRYETFGIAFDFGLWKKILITIWPLFFAVILNLLYFRTDTIILSWFHSEETVGIYGLPYKLLEGFLAFPAMFVGLVMPLLSHAAFRNWKRFKQIWQGTFDSLVLLGIPVIVVALFFAEPIISLLGGEGAYHDSPGLLKILSLAAATIFLGTLFGYAVVAINQQKAMIKGYLLGAAVGLILYFLFIPHYSYWGAAWGTVVSELVVAIYAYFLVRSRSRQKLSLKIFIPALPPIMVMVLFFSLASLPWILEIALGLVVYATGLILTRAIPSKLVKEVWPIQNQ